MGKVWFDKNLILVENKRTTIDDDIDRGREMDDDDVRDWEKNLIKGSYIPGMFFGSQQQSVILGPSSWIDPLQD